MIRQDILKNIKRVVIKIGSSVISNKDKGRSSLECGLSKDWVRHYARQIKLIQDKGYDVVLVSSGAIMAGAGKVGVEPSRSFYPRKAGLRCYRPEFSHAHL